MQSSHCDASTSFSTIRSSRGLRPEASKGIFTGCHLAKRRSRSCPVIRQTVSKIRLSCQKRKDRDPITAYRTEPEFFAEDRKSTRLNSSHRCISYAVFCLKKKIQLHGLQG